MSLGAEMRAPDYIEPIVGWRSWDVDMSNCTLNAHNAGGGGAYTIVRQTETGEEVIHQDHRPHRLWRPGYAQPSQCNDPFTTYRVVNGSAEILGDVTQLGKHPGRPAPVLGCTCGYYAARTLNVTHVHGIGLRCVGRVAMWGKVVEHSGGWRAQYAYPLDIYLAWVEKAHDGYHRSRGPIMTPPGHLASWVIGSTPPQPDYFPFSRGQNWDRLRHIAGTLKMRYGLARAEELEVDSTHALFGELAQRGLMEGFTTVGLLTMPTGQACKPWEWPRHA